jgi:hypothetical protein
MEGLFRGRIGAALKAGDLGRAESIVRQRLGVSDPSVPVWLWCQHAARSFAVPGFVRCPGPSFLDRPDSYGSGDIGWSDPSWLMWFRNRIDCFGLLTKGVKGSPPPCRLEVLLHVWFLHLEETEEMLARLRHEQLEPPKPAAGSKVFTTNLVPRPIDRVAARVSGIHGACRERE